MQAFLLVTYFIIIFIILLLSLQNYTNWEINRNYSVQPMPRFFELLFNTLPEAYVISPKSDSIFKKNYQWLMMLLCERRFSILENVNVPV